MLQEQSIYLFSALKYWSTFQVSITKGDCPETSVAMFLFDTDENAMRYFYEINRKCSLYCFELAEAIVGVTKEDYNRGNTIKKLLHFGAKEKAPRKCLNECHHANMFEQCRPPLQLIFV